MRDQDAGLSKSRGRPLGWMAAGVAVCALAGCGPEVKPTGPAGGTRAAEALRLGAATPPLAGKEKALESRRLEKLWDVYLGERPKGLWQLGEAVYVLTDLNRLYSVGVADGLVRWQYNLPEGLDQEPAGYSYAVEGLETTDELFLISKNVLHVLDRQHGYLMWKLRLPFPASSPPSASFSHIYVGSWDDRIYAISKDDQAVGWYYRTDAPVTAQAEPTERSVESLFVASEDGVLYSMNPAYEDRKWHVQSRGALVSAPLFYKNHVYFGSRDMFLYCLLDGQVEWKYPAGAPLVSKPIAFAHDFDLGGPKREEALYVLTENRQLLAVNLRPDVAKQYLRWSYPGVDRLLAHGRGDIYVLDRSGGLVALSEERGEVRWDTPFVAGAAYYAQNTMSARSRRKEERDLSTIMCMAFQTGWIAAIKEKGEY